MRIGTRPSSAASSDVGRPRVTNGQQARPLCGYSGYAPQRHRFPLIASAIAASSAMARPSRTAADRRHDLAGRTVAALHVHRTRYECALHRVAIRRPSARPSIVTICVAFGAASCQRQACQHPAAVDVNRAGAALALIAAFFRPRQGEVFAQGVQQGHPRFERELVRFAVDIEPDGSRGGVGGKRAVGDHLKGDDPPI